MNNDYLWNRTGEPDPEIQKLEQVLGTLRYQPRPLEIPARLQTGRRRFFFPSFALAAAIALMLLGVGLWLALHRREAVTPGAAEVNYPLNEKPGPAKGNSAPESPDQSGLTAAMPAKHKPAENKGRQGIVRNAVARHRNLTPGLVVKKPEFTAKEQEEAESAKEQLILALRVASEKLNLAQKKAQSTTPANIIRNQHKVG